jgi:hypothetical protein
MYVKRDMKLRLKSHPQILAISPEPSTSRLQYGTGNETWKIRTTSEQLRVKMLNLLAPEFDI